MVKEVSLITIDPAEAGDFERVYREVAPVIRRQSGCLHDELLRVVESDREYFLVIHWEEVASHQAFIDSPDFELVKGSWGPFQKKVVVRHCSLIDRA